MFGTIRGTNTHSKMEKDHNGNWPFKRAVLRDRNGDLSKEWYVEYYAWDEASECLVRKRIKIPQSFQTKKARVQEANKIIADTNQLLERGYYFKKTSVDVKTDIVTESENDLLLSLEKVLDIINSSLRPKTNVTYRSATNKLREYANQQTFSIFKFTDKEVIKFRDHLVTVQGNSARTANNTLMHLATIYSHLKDRADVPQNPFKLKKLKQEETNKNIAFNDVDREKVEKYMALHEPELFAFTRFIYYAFIRPGELKAIEIQDIRFNEKYILVRGAISKNGKSETVSIISALLAVIDRMELSKRDPFLYLFGKGLIPGKEVSGKQVAFRRHEKILKKLKLDNKGYTLYSWKHTGAVNAYLSGVGIKQLQLMLRHSTVQMTDIYLKSLGLRTDPNIENYNW